MNKLLRFLLFLVPSAILVFVWFHAAQAAPTAEGPPIDTTTLSEVLSQAVKLLAAVLMIVVPWLVKRAIEAVETKAKIDIPQQQEVLIDKWVEQGVHFAEEKARTWIRQKRVRMPGGAKAETALDYVWDLVQRSGLVDCTREMLVAKIDAKVNQKRESAPTDGSMPLPLSP